MATNEFLHIPLKLIKDAPPIKPKGFSSKKDPITIANEVNPKAHGEKLLTSLGSIQKSWCDKKARRNKDELPMMPEAIPLYLRVDPDALPIEDIRKFGIEVISELEDGFVLGASADVHFNQLSNKINKFINEKEKKAASVWDFFQGNDWRIQNILSPYLQENWFSIGDSSLLIVDIGIACLSTIDVPEHPRKRKSQLNTEEKYQKAVVNWTRKRDEAYEEWNKIARERIEDFLHIVKQYEGQVLTMDRGKPGLSSKLPDCVNVRIKIAWRGVKDIVLNYPFVFDITEAQDIGSFPIDGNNKVKEEPISVSITPPTESAPYVCVIDSGIQEKHLLLKDAIDSATSKSWITSPTDVADYVKPGGHGTKVAGAILYPNGIPVSGEVKPTCWIQNARVLDKDNSMPKEISPSEVLEQIVETFYNSSTHTRIYNHSINSLYPCRTIHMSHWAATIDKLCWEKDVLFTVSIGNLPLSRPSNSEIRLGIRDHLVRGRKYPEFLLEDSSRIADPAQSLQAITVGSVGIKELNGIYNSFSKATEPSSFSCAGPGIWGVIKPDVVEFGGDFALDMGNPQNIVVKEELCPQLVRSTLYGGSLFAKDEVGTSFATSKVTHIVAKIAEVFPNESTLLHRALLIQSARWPSWAENAVNKSPIIRHLGYGIPDLERAVENSEYRITLVTSGEMIIKGRQVHIYEVKIPEDLRKPVDEYKFRLDVTLSYKAEPRRTRRHRKRYLSTWLDWQTSKQNETPEEFAKRMIEQSENEEASSGNDAPLFNWNIRERDDWGAIIGVNRKSGTVQKDWAIVESNKLSKGFCIAIIGHVGWNTDPEAGVPYSLAVSFEAINQDIELYSKIAIANEVEFEVQIEN
ncbi:S8 family peptidase [Bacillus cereus]|uniref:S8 family peptidase n=1 Tax=Bacillus sp. RB3 TaxID=3050012 RepID=UPI0025406613|nr:S8 family peptidase [Bacillus sp. RB3]MDK3011617.1 S8 family peptidase [Bacillus sp. RB3]MDZ4439044.1 S8 family peptidase [Bacillus cereus]